MRIDIIKFFRNLFKKLFLTQKKPFDIYERPEQSVVAAAIRNRDDGRIVVSARHFDELMIALIEQIDPGFTEHPEYFKAWRTSEQGFIDNRGKFLTREEALDIVKRSGQRYYNHSKEWDTKLYSESLY